MMDQVAVLIGRTFKWCAVIVGALVGGYLLGAVVRSLLF